MHVILYIHGVLTLRGVVDSMYSMLFDSAAFQIGSVTANVALLGVRGYNSVKYCHDCVLVTLELTALLGIREFFFKITRLAPPEAKILCAYISDAVYTLFIIECLLDERISSYEKHCTLTCVS